MKNIILLSMLMCSSAFAQISLDNEIITLSNGIKIEKLTKTTKPASFTNGNISVSYKGTLKNGFEFDSSKDQRVNFNLNNLISCWKDAIPKLNVGEIAKITCPSESAYGARPLPGIPANSDLIFEIKLFSAN